MATTPLLSYTEEDIEVAASLGMRIYFNVISSIMESLAWGAYFVTFIIALNILRRRGFETTAKKVMLLVTLVLFSSSTVLWALNVSWTFLRIHGVLVTGWDQSWEDRADYVATTFLEPLGTPMEALFMLNMLLGDAVVVARAKVLWDNNWKVIAIPCFLLLAALTFSILGIVCLEIGGFGRTSALAEGSYVCRRAEPIAWALSIITNVISTSLIAYRAWNHRKVINYAYPHRKGLSPMERALLLVVESGFVYILLLVSQLAVFWDGSGNASAFAFAVLAPLGDQITGLYATSIIVIVTLHRTSWDGTRSDLLSPRTAVERTTASSVHFADGPGDLRSENVNMVPKTTFELKSRSDESRTLELLSSREDVNQDSAKV